MEKGFACHPIDNLKYVRIIEDTAQSSGPLLRGEEAKIYIFSCKPTVFQICVRKLKNGPSYEMKTTFKT